MKTEAALILAAAGLYLLTQRKAVAQVLGQPVTTSSIQPPKIVSYMQQPSAAAQYGSLQATGNSGQASPVTAGINFLTALVNKGASSAVSQASPYDTTGMRISNGDTSPTDPAYGWQYFTGGTAIAPNGTYYQNGEEVWHPQVLQDNPTAYNSYSDTYGINGF